jgi:hypothetical protein
MGFSVFIKNVFILNPFISISVVLLHEAHTSSVDFGFREFHFSSRQLTGQRISREDGKAEGFDGRCRLVPRGCAARSAKQATEHIAMQHNRATSASSQTTALLLGLLSQV